MEHEEISSDSKRKEGLEINYRVKYSNLAKIKELGHRLRWVTGDDLSHHHLVQRLSVAIQRGNCASVLGSSRSFDAPCLFS